MPFIKPERRAIIDLEGLEKLNQNDKIEVGDRCYVFYKEMVRQWRASPRWATAHMIYKQMVSDVRRPNPLMYDDEVAYALAWQVFFIKYVMPYEEQKIKENGEI